MNDQISFQFLGGIAHQDNPTGSAILLTLTLKNEVKRILVDIGLFQNPIHSKNDFSEFYEKNRDILRKMDPQKIDVLIFTHGHMDHIGRSVLLSNYGLNDKTQIKCTRPSAEILKIMLKDSAQIQEAYVSEYSDHNTSSGRFVKDPDRRKKKLDQEKRKNQSLSPLYTLEDTEKFLKLVPKDGHPYHSWIPLFSKVCLKFYRSSHVLGGAICVLRIKTRHRTIHLGFSGDLGRKDGLLLSPPDKIEEPLDFWFTESTYGGKLHSSRKTEVDKLVRLIHHAKDKNMKIIIPAFSLQRTQEILFLLSFLFHYSRQTGLRVYLDSPLATELTKVYDTFWDTDLFFGQDRLAFRPFSFEENTLVSVVSETKESESLLSLEEPLIILAGSGMCDAGRVKSHLKKALSDKNVMVLLMGYMAEETLGRSLKDGSKIVFIDGEEIRVNAEIHSFSSFSSHADGPFLVEYTKDVVSLAKEEGISPYIFIVHGETEGAIALKRDLCSFQLDASRIVIPRLYEKFDFSF